MRTVTFKNTENKDISVIDLHAIQAINYKDGVIEVMLNGTGGKFDFSGDPDKGIAIFEGLRSAWETRDEPVQEAPTEAQSKFGGTE